MVRLGAERRRHRSELAARRHRPRHRRPHPLPPDRRDPRRRRHAVATSAVREAENAERLHRPGPRRGRGRRRRHHRRRGGAPHPPRRAAGGAGVRPAACCSSTSAAAPPRCSWARGARCWPPAASSSARSASPAGSSGPTACTRARSTRAAATSARCWPRSPGEVRRPRLRGRGRQLGHDRDGGGAGPAPRDDGDADPARSTTSSSPATRSTAVVERAGRRRRTVGRAQRAARAWTRPGRHHPRRGPRSSSRRWPSSASTSMVISDYALREGVLLDALAARAGRGAPPPARPPAPQRACTWPS